MKKSFAVITVIAFLLSGISVFAEERTKGVNYKIKRLASQLYSKKERMKARRRLAGYGKEATEYILPILKEKGNDAARVSALCVLAAVEDESAEDEVVSLLKDRNHLVRQEAAKTLGIIGKKDSSVDALKKLLNDPFPNVRFNVIRAMARMPREKDEDIFINALGDYDPRIRKFSIIALGDLKSRKAVQYLSQMVRDFDPDVRLELTKAFGKIGTAECLQPLVWLVSDLSPEIRRSAVEEIGRIKEGDKEGALVQITESMHPDITAKGIEVLTDMNSGKVLAIAKNHLDDEHMVIKLAAIYAIGRMGGNDEKTILMELLEAESTKMRKAAQEALDEINK